MEKKIVNNVTTKDWTPNEKQKKIVDFLKAHKGETFTLAELSTATGEELKSGTINVLTAREIIISHKDARTLVCECCGHKRKVSTYEINQ